MTVGQSPILLWRVKKQTQYVETETVFLVTGPFIGADEDAAFELRVCQHHYLSQKKDKMKFFLMIEGYYRVLPGILVQTYTFYYWGILYFPLVFFFSIFKVFAVILFAILLGVWISTIPQPSMVLSQGVRDSILSWHTLHCQNDTKQSLASMNSCMWKKADSTYLSVRYSALRCVWGRMCLPSPSCVTYMAR